MTKQQVENMLEEIRKISKDEDNELAHCMEDQLWDFVLTAISTGIFDGHDCAELARTAILSKSIKFTRWYA